jgi:membrane-bound lytic murein transglycosylase B
VKRMLSIGLGLAMSLPVLANSLSYDEYIAGIKAEAKQAGISSSILDAAFKGANYKPKIVAADNNQPEKRLTLDEYLPRALPKWKVDRARKLYKENYPQLARIGNQYGVQPRFIVALWGIESNFGRNMGSYSVINSLTTLAYDGRRESFFRAETMAALQILQQGHISPDLMKGSWAGAMGQCQFMPSSFLAYAADGNGDGKKDIWSTKADVFASAANYLSQSGWDDKYTWGREVKLPRGFNFELSGRESNKAKLLSQWRHLGITRSDGRLLPQPNTDIKAWLITPDDEHGRAYLVYNNYNVLMKWNRSYYFGVAVSKLADLIDK